MPSTVSHLPVRSWKTAFVITAGSVALVTLAYATSRPAPHVRLADASDHSGGPAVPTPTPRPTPVALAQGLGGLQFSEDQGRTWIDFDRGHPLAVTHQNESLGLRAVKRYARLPWPDRPLKPEWHKGDKTNWGEKIFVAYEDVTAPDTSNIVTVECGNTLTGHIAVIPMHEILISPSKTRARILAPDSGAVETTQVTATARVTDIHGVRCPGLKVRFSAVFTDGTVPGSLTGVDKDGTSVTDADGNATATLGNVTREGYVIMEATCIDADGKQYAHSKTPPIHFIARHRENEDPPPPQLPDPEKHTR